MNVWIDLEETIINNWNDGLLIHHVNNIRNWLTPYNLQGVNIYSFAIYDNADKNDFVVSGMKEAIETALQHPIIDYPSVEEISQVVYQYEKIKYDSQFDFIQMNGKHWSFIKYCMMCQVGKHNVLIDDAVPNWNITDNKTNTIVDLINVVDICCK